MPRKIKNKKIIHNDKIIDYFLEIPLIITSSPDAPVLDIEQLKIKLINDVIKIIY
jgi:hypothetical protein